MRTLHLGAPLRHRRTAAGPARRRAAAAALVALGLLLAACGQDTGGDPAADPTPAGASTTTEPGGPGGEAPGDDTDDTDDGADDGAGEGSGAAPALDPAFAVEAPGPLEGPPQYADILVVAQDTIDPETVAAIDDLDDVSVESMSLAQASIEGKVLNVAVVDPASYRAWTTQPSPEAQEVWDRVAAGEVAVASDLEKKLPTDDDGFLRLGSAEDSEEVHVGAFAPQIPNAVDAVVNEKWGAAIGAKPANALLVSTGTTAPDRVVGPLQRMLPGQTSIQRLDVVATLGLDIDAAQTAFVVGAVADAVGTFNYTVIGGGRIAPEPSWVSTHIVTADVPILGSVTCNKAIIPQLTAALREVVERGLGDKIIPGQYGGCYYPRFIAGSTTLSNHSFGLALDFNVPGNLRGTVGEIDRGVVDIFKKWGFTWGGDWSYTDPMHFEANRIVDPR
ncbi:M15 family metallopeptidase [Nocardioides kribbensis]|uniref:M15 family metallopeptidase n=1 Tax=Nocardioides kribbensis TaxID=305517 RepID=UPI0032DB9D03